MEDRPRDSSNWEPPRVRELSTDADGRFAAEVELFRPAADNEPIGSVLVYAHLHGLTDCSLYAGDNVIRMSPGVSVGGSVIEASKKPVIDALVKLTGLEGDDDSVSAFLQYFPQLQELYTAKSDRDGQWRIDDLPDSGRVTFNLDDPRFVSARAVVELSGAPPVVPTFVVEPGTIIIGKVTLPDGTPDADAEVTAQSEATQGGGYSQATTGADGAYRLIGLPEGTYRITVMDFSGKSAPSGIEGIATKLSQTVEAPPIAMDAGVLAVGSVLDADTKAPLAGASVVVECPYGSAYSTMSDANGQYKVRVPLGDRRLYTYLMPEGYLLTKDGNFNLSRIGFTITNEQRVIPSISLTKGEVLRGTVVDVTGKAAEGAVLFNSLEWFGFENAKVDANGNWKISPVRRGAAIRIGVRGSWQVMKPEGEITLADDNVTVVLRRVPLVNLRGRVVSDDGKPVSAVKIDAKITLNGGNSWRYRTTSTDSDGRYAFAHMRPQEPVSITATIPDFIYKSGGEVKVEAGGLNAVGIVLAPLAALLKGQVVDNAGAPVAGARVLCPDYLNNDLVVTDAQGHFVMTSMAAGDTNVMAAHGFDWGEASGRAGDGEPDVTIRLNDDRHPQILGEGPVAALVEEWVTAGNKTRDFQANEAVLEIAAVDPDKALELVTRDDGTATAEALDEIMNKVIESDPGTAAEWIPLHLDGITDKQSQLMITAQLGAAVADARPDVAEAMYRRAKAAMNPLDYSWSAVYSFAQMAALASKLKYPEANSLLQAALVAVERSVDQKRRPDVLGVVAELVAPGDVSLLDRVLGELDDLGKMGAMERAVQAVAKSNPAAATILFDRMKKLMQSMDADSAGPVVPGMAAMYHPTPRQSVSRAAMALAPALAPTDIGKAIEIAGDVDVNQRGDVLLAIAQFARGDAAIALYRQAVEKVAQSGSSGLISRAAALVYKADPKLGEDFFEQARREIAQSAKNTYEPEMRETYAEYAFYRAPIDPATSRLLLEAELQWRLGDKTWQGDYGKSRAIAKIAEAMVALDANRALEISKLLTKDTWVGDHARAAIVHYLLTPVSQRSTMAFPQQ